MQMKQIQNHAQETSQILQKHQNTNYKRFMYTSVSVSKEKSHFNKLV